MKRALSGSVPLLSNIAVIALHQNEIVPPEFKMIDTTPSGADANLNFGVKGNQTYLCVRYLREGVHITNLLTLSQRQKDIPADAFRLRSTVGGKEATLGLMSKDPYHLYFVKDWASMLLTPSSLRPTSASESTEGTAGVSAETDSFDEDLTLSLDKIPVSPLLDTPIESTPIESIPVESVPMKATSFKSVSAEVIDQHRATLRMLLPLLVGCHCGDSTVVRTCVEALHHFIQSSPVQTERGLVDPLVDSILACLYEGALDIPAFSNASILDILTKMVGNKVITQGSMAYLLRLSSALMRYLFHMEDRGKKNTRQYEKLFHSLHTIARMLTNRASQEQGEQREQGERRKDIQKVLEEYAFKLESPGSLLVGEMTSDMLEVCERIGGGLELKNTVLYLLVLLGDLRRYGRV